MGKTLNNTAALCIETGHYDRAIACLVEALQLSDRHYDGPPTNYASFQSRGDASSSSSPSPSGACQCRYCSLDGCIVFSERTPLATHSSDVDDRAIRREDAQDDAGEPDGYVHRRPIRVTPQSTQDGHDMGVTLSLIVTFNLALAHHLNALATFGVEGGDGDGGRTYASAAAASIKLGRRSSVSSNAYKQTFQRILHLYELAYRWQIELEEDRIQKQRRAQQQQQQQQQQHDDWFAWGLDGGAPAELDASPVTSLRFNMIICNNLSQIHRLVQNRTKHQRCLEHLLATMMFVVVADGSGDQRYYTPTAVAGPASSTGTGGPSGACPPNQFMDFEGFLINASPLILQVQCAGAA